MLPGAAEHGVAVGHDLGHRLDRQHAGRRHQGADQRRGDAPAHGQPFDRALRGHPVEGQLGQVADEHPGAAAALLGEPGRVDHDQLGQFGQHVLRQELQQVPGVPGGVDDQHAPGGRGAAEEVDRLDDRLLDQDDPVGVRVLVDEPVEDRLVGEPGVPAHQAVGPVRVVDVVADVLGVVAEPSGGGGDAGGDVARLLVHDDPSGPDSELVVHGRARFRDCIPSAGHRYGNPTLRTVKARERRFCPLSQASGRRCRVLPSMRARVPVFRPRGPAITQRVTDMTLGRCAPGRLAVNPGMRHAGVGRAVACDFNIAVPMPRRYPTR